MRRFGWGGRDGHCQKLLDDLVRPSTYYVCRKVLSSPHVSYFGYVAVKNWKLRVWPIYRTIAVILLASGRSRCAAATLDGVERAVVASAALAQRRLRKGRRDDRADVVARA